MGTYSPDRQRGLEALAAGAGPRVARPGRLRSPGRSTRRPRRGRRNVERFEHLPPARHAAFYGAQRFTLNLTRADMVSAGWSPSVRLFEAAAIGTPIMSDDWPGLKAFFEPGEEILIAHSSEQVVGYLSDVDEARRQAIAAAAKRRVLAFHTAGSARAGARGLRRRRARPPAQRRSRASASDGGRLSLSR